MPPIVPQTQQLRNESILSACACTVQENRGLATHLAKDDHFTRPLPWQGSALDCVVWHDTNVCGKVGVVAKFAKRVNACKRLLLFVDYPNHFV